MNGVVPSYGHKPLFLTKTKTKVKADSNNINKNTNNEVTEIRVCTNQPCKKQSSLEIMQTLSAILPPGISVVSCGCLGSCGMGPNLVFLPGATRIKHCSTPARAVRTMFDNVVGSDSGIDAEMWIKNTLLALALRKKAEGELGDGGDRNQAEKLLSEAINLNPCGGGHHLYKVRSDARLIAGNVADALADAQEAITQAPKYTEAYICEADALMALHQYEAAAKSYGTAVELDHSILRSKPFKARMAKLQEKLIPADSK